MTTEVEVTGKPCGHCRSLLQPGDKAAVCASCGAVHHAACWAFNGQCSTPDCTGSPNHVTAPAGTYQSPAAPLAPPPGMVPPTPAPPRITMPGPMQGNIPASSDLGTVITAGWQAYLPHVGTAIGALVVMILLMLPVGILMIIPVLGWFGAIVLASAFVGGGVRLIMNIVNNDNPQIGDLFSGFSRIWSFAGAYCLLVIISMLCSLPQLIVQGAQFAAMFSAMLPSILHGAGGAPPVPPAPTPGMTGMVMMAALLSMAIQLAVLPRFMFTLFLVNDGHGAVEALSLSNTLVAPRLLMAIVTSIVIGLIYIAGILGCGVGLLFTAPLSMVIMGCYYNAVRAEERL